MRSPCVGRILFWPHLVADFWSDSIELLNIFSRWSSGALPFLFTLLMHTVWRLNKNTTSRNSIQTLLYEISTPNEDFVTASLQLRLQVTAGEDNRTVLKFPDLPAELSTELVHKDNLLFTISWSFSFSTLGFSSVQVGISVHVDRISVCPFICQVAFLQFFRINQSAWNAIDWVMIIQSEFD